MDFQSWMIAVQNRTERALERLLPPAGIAPRRLHEAMRYATLGGGKRVRPLLCHAAGDLAGAGPDRLDIAGCAVEMIHAYSLIHDDLPCMDDDTLRRGKPTCHVRFGEATALLAGDALQSQAFLILSGHDVADDMARRMEMLHLLAQAAGSRGMAGGQAMDLDAVGRTLSPEDLEAMHVHKTGALIRAAVRLGASCGQPIGGEAFDRLDRYANRIGLLFQVVDDILDVGADTATLGKTAGKDAAREKPTYAGILGLAEARRHAEALHAQALEALEPFGEKARRLRELTGFIVTRKF